MEIMVMKSALMFKHKTMHIKKNIVEAYEVLMHLKSIQSIKISSPNWGKYRWISY